MCPYGSTFEIFEQKTLQILFLGAFLRKRIQFLNALGRFRSELTEIPYITNGIIEGINNKIKVLKRQIYGFRNEEYFKLRLYALHDRRLRI